MNNKKNVTVIVAVMAGILIVFGIFFVLTVHYSAPVAMKLQLPENIDTAFTKAAKSGDAITLVLLGKNNIFYYYGNDLEAGKKINADGIKEVLVKKKKSSNPATFFVAIKPSVKASYKNVADALDEMLMNDIKRYATAGISPEEARFIETLQ